MWFLVQAEILSSPHHQNQLWSPKICIRNMHNTIWSTPFIFKCYGQRNFIAMNREALNQLPPDQIRSLHSISISPPHQDNSSHKDLQWQFCIHIKHEMCQIQTIFSLTWRIQGDHFGGYVPTQHLDHQHSPFPGSWQWLHPQTWGMSAERLSRQQPSGLPTDMGT